MKNRKRIKLSDEAYETIKDLILSGEWAPGYHAFEPEIADQLGISRTPVRQALIRIEAEGLIQIKPRRGVYVAPLSIPNVSHIYETLIAIETMAAELSSQGRGGGDFLERMYTSIETMKAAVGTGDNEIWIRSDDEFHRSVVMASGNPYLIDSFNRVYNLMNKVKIMQISADRSSTLKISISDHEAIADAIKHRNVALASQLAREHRERGLSMILDIIKPI